MGTAAAVQIVELRRLPRDLPRTGDLPNLDVLRAIAVLCVLVSHLGPHDSWGWLGGFGVLIFFVHTAFVLMLSMERTGQRPGWISSFYRQRIFRIYPLSILCVALIWAFRVPTRMPLSFTYLSANFLLVQNVLKEPSSIIGPLWSLPFEVQMYLVLPFVFLAVRRQRDMIVALIPVSMVFATAELVAHSGTWMLEYVPCFLGGVLAYTRRNRSGFLPAWVWPLCILSLGGIYWTGGKLMEWPVSLALGWGIAWFRDLGSGTVATVAKLVARYSYGIYLAHIPLIWICFQRGEEMRFTPASCLAFAFLIVAIPVVTYHAIEQPLIQLGKRPLGSWIPNLSPARNKSLAS